jgi:hypothetical protein
MLGHFAGWMTHAHLAVWAMVVRFEYHFWFIALRGLSDRWYVSSTLVMRAKH